VNVVRSLSRPMVAAMFVYGGFDALRHPDPKVPRAKIVTDPITDLLPVDDTDAVDIVLLNGAVQVGAGLTLALGVLPRLSAMLLAASLIPTTAAGHRFWEETDQRARSQQTIHFLKNVSMLGGLLAVATAPRLR